MPDAMQSAIKWFLSEFGARAEADLQGTPFTRQLLAAIAVQETYEVWGGLYTNPTISTERLLQLCVGDTIDAPARSAFPRNRAELEALHGGAAIFEVARAALDAGASIINDVWGFQHDPALARVAAERGVPAVIMHNRLEDVGTVSASYHKVAVANPSKFCHGFGIFQYDIQFCKTNPDFFVNRKWYSFDECLKVFVLELKAAVQATYGSAKTSLAHDEMVYVAIAYNKGSAKVGGGFKQGFKDPSGKYYGELIDTFLTMAEQV